MVDSLTVVTATHLEESLITVITKYEVVVSSEATKKAETKDENVQKLSSSRQRKKAKFKQNIVS